LISVSDKTGLVELGRALASQGVEILASGGTARALTEGGVKVQTVESFTGSPEAFQGRMKTLSFRVFSAILARRRDASDARDLERLAIPTVDLVVVNFYPFESARDAAKEERELIEEIDIGGPALVRAAAKNAPDVLVLADPKQYSGFLKEFGARGEFSSELAWASAARAWSRVREYDAAIEDVFGETRKTGLLSLKYGENPHQSARFEMHSHSPIAYDRPLTDQPISYNNILDLSAAYQLTSELKARFPERVHVVVVKHGNPSGVASVPKSDAQALDRALELAWLGDPISAFGGVLAFSEPLSPAALKFFDERFVECLVAPGLRREDLQELLLKRKGLKALSCRYEEDSKTSLPSWRSVDVVGGRLCQEVDRVIESEPLRFVTAETDWSTEVQALAQFGISVNRALKSNAISIVGSVRESWVLLGAGQGQPNRIDSLQTLAVPRARATCERVGATWSEVILMSDAFFPFSDAIEACDATGVKRVVQPGGSVRDPQVIEAAKRLGVEMAFTGIRHFLH
jgi:phosphoribosylaminoimidazolecarboxamide formyltransferase/IMP cyclohydrolase